MGDRISQPQGTLRNAPAEKIIFKIFWKNYLRNILKKFFA